MGLFFFGTGWFWFCYYYVVKTNQSQHREVMLTGMFVVTLASTLPQLLNLWTNSLILGVLIGLSIAYCLAFILLRYLCSTTLKDSGKILIGHFAGCALVIGVPAVMMMDHPGWF